MASCRKSPEARNGPRLTVSNHLTYLDILVYGAVRPFVLVAKSEVRRWPLLATLASWGHDFVDRGRSLQVAEASQQIEQGLRDGLAVLVLFEGTSSDGQEVLPFYRHSLSLRYGPAPASRQRRFGTTPPLLGGDLLGRDGLCSASVSYSVRLDLTAEIRFDSPCRFSDRKTAARVAWLKVHGLRR